MKKSDKIYLESIELLGEQLKQSYHESKKIKLPKSYQLVNKIIICGMGGSQLGADIVKHLFSEELKLPLLQIKGYNLPQFVDSKSLTIFFSYSGNTEEVLSMLSQAKKRKIKILIITTGGKLGKQAKNNNIPAYIFDPINNPSGQPRLGVAYNIGALLSIFKQLKIINITEGQISKMIKAAELEPKVKKFGQKLKNKIPVFIASEFLQGNAHTVSNQINESAKQLALYYSIPEIGHHLLEGLTLPATNKKSLHFFFLYSEDYHPRNQKRYNITQQILAKQRIPYTQMEFKGDKLEQAMQMLKFGALLSFELSKLNQVNPNKIPWVNLLKRKLK